MIPTLRTPLGANGHRPLVGNLDCPEYVYVFGALTLVSGRLTTRIVGQPRKRQTAPHRAISKPAVRSIGAISLGPLRPCASSPVTVHSSK